MSSEFWGVDGGKDGRAGRRKLLSFFGCGVAQRNGELQAANEPNCVNYNAGFRGKDCRAYDGDFVLDSLVELGIQRKGGDEGCREEGCVGLV